MTNPDKPKICKKLYKKRYYVIIKLYYNIIWRNYYGI